MGKPSRKTGTATEEPPLTLEAIMAEHQEAIRRYVERQGFRGADRDDLLQEIFHGAARSLPRFDPRLGTVRTWLMRIAFNHISHERQRAHRRHEELWPEEALEGLSSAAPDSETRLIEAQRSDVLADLLLEVPPRRREILVAHDLEEEEVPDIAEERAMPRSTVWNHLRLARLSLDAAARRWRARNRGRGALLAPLAVAFGATEARAASGPLHGGQLRRLLDWARGALRPARPHGEAGRRALSRRTSSPVATRAAGRSMASSAAGAAAAALVLLAPAGTGEIPLPGAHAGALHAPAAAFGVQRGGVFPSGPGAPSEQRAAGAASDALETETARLDAASRRHPPGLLRDEDATSPPERPRTPEEQLIRQAIASRTAGRDDIAWNLLDQHRREFPHGAYAGQREALLRRLPAPAHRRFRAIPSH
ncbi:sigma-70 family RNA polymerase sigma factor [Sorangium sp. So ce429]